MTPFNHSNHNILSLLFFISGTKLSKQHELELHEGGSMSSVRAPDLKYFLVGLIRTLISARVVSR